MPLTPDISLIRMPIFSALRVQRARVMRCRCAAAAQPTEAAVDDPPVHRRTHQRRRERWHAYVKTNRNISITSIAETTTTSVTANHEGGVVFLNDRQKAARNATLFYSRNGTGSKQPAHERAVRMTEGAAFSAFHKPP